MSASLAWIRGGLPGRVGAMLRKEFVQMRRDRVTLAMMAAIPLTQLVLFGYAINTTPRDLPTAVLLQESSDVGRSILAALQNTKYSPHPFHPHRAIGPAKGLYTPRLANRYDLARCLDVRRHDDRRHAISPDARLTASAPLHSDPHPPFLTTLAFDRMAVGCLATYVPAHG